MPPIRIEERVLVNVWGALGFGNNMFHVFQSLHEAWYYNRSFVLLADSQNWRWDYSFGPGDLLVLPSQRNMLSSREVGNIWHDVRWHDLGYWDKPIMFSMPPSFTSLHVYWRDLIRRVFRPSPTLLAAIAAHLGGHLAEGCECSRNRPFHETFRDCIMPSIHRDHQEWPRPWVSVHIRAADSLPDEDRPIVGVRTMRDLLQRLPEGVTRGTVLLATDAPDYDFGSAPSWTVKKMALNRNKYDSNTTLIEFRKDLASDQVLLDALADIGFLIQGDILVLPLYGSFARLIAALGKLSAAVISSDGSQWCPFHACDVGRQDAKFCTNGGSSGHRYLWQRRRRVSPMWTAAQCKEDPMPADVGSVPPEVRPLWSLACRFAADEKVSSDECYAGLARSNSSFRF